MNRRSRKGCIDCKRSKIKCDEVSPHCGTCLRRGYACQGYPESVGAGSPLLLTSNAAEDRGGSKFGRRRHEQRSTTSQVDAVVSEDERNNYESKSDTGLKSHLQSKNKIRDYAAVTPCSSDRARPASMQIERANHTPICPRIPSIPRGTIRSADEPIIELYFLRHPSDLVISSEFVDEMNSNVLQVFHEDPEGVCDSLSAIGYLYLEGGQALIPFLDRKARILARLRDQTELEKMLIMLLGLCALELIDVTTGPAESALPAIIANAALIIKHTEDTGGAITSVAQYFIRALARQDMMISLGQARRPLIPYSTWLEDDCQYHADRFMGFTMSFMPYLGELSALAQDLRSQTCCPIGGQSKSLEDTNITEDDIIPFIDINTRLSQRAIDLRSKIEQWRPLPAQTLSFQSAQNLLFHAHAHKAAAILYLHRLISPPGTSEMADRIALSMAHEILMYLSAMTDQLKTALWPVLVAGSELACHEDRETALQMFNEIYRQRKTITSLRTRNFCVERVWRARDDGLNWNWIDLAHQYPGECVPI